MYNPHTPHTGREEQGDSQSRISGEMTSEGRKLHLMLTLTHIKDPMCMHIRWGKKYDRQECDILKIRISGGWWRLRVGGNGCITSKGFEPFSCITQPHPPPQPLWQVHTAHFTVHTAHSYLTALHIALSKCTFGKCASVQVHHGRQSGIWTSVHSFAQVR